jgi:putative endonuclease
MKYYVYVLKSKKDKKNYYGFTTDIKRRIIEHNNGLVKSTRGRRPFELLYSEIVDTRTDARKREKYFKSGFGRKYIKSKINKLALSSNG